MYVFYVYDSTSTSVTMWIESREDVSVFSYPEHLLGCHGAVSVSPVWTTLITRPPGRGALGRVVRQLCLLLRYDVYRTVLCRG